MMPCSCKECAQRIADLEAQVRDYKRLLEGDPATFRLGLTRSEAAIVQAMVARSPNFLSIEMIYNLLYGGALNPPQPKIIHIFLHKIRKKTQPHGILIETLFGRGYRLTADNLARLETFRNHKEP